MALHRLIMGAEQGVAVDHINGNTLDNRRQNLRFAGSTGNNRNKRLDARSRTGFKGVRKNGRRWVAIIQFSGRALHLGTFDTPSAAAKAYDDAARKYFGEFAALNFPRPFERTCLRQFTDSADVNNAKNKNEVEKEVEN